jgi:hypothetical protein
MATVYASKNYPQKAQKFEYSTTGAQEWITGLQMPMSVALFPTGEARIEYTFAPVEELSTTTDILTWPNGNVIAGSDSGIYSNVTAIRCNVVSGTAVMYIAGQVI